MTLIPVAKRFAVELSLPVFTTKVSRDRILNPNIPLERRSKLKIVYNNSDAFLNGELAKKFKQSASFFLKTITFDIGQTFLLKQQKYYFIKCFCFYLDILLFSSAKYNDFRDNLTAVTPKNPNYPREDVDGYSTVCNNSTVCNYSLVRSYSMVCDNSMVCSYSMVCNYSMVCKYSTICNYSMVCNYSKVCNYSMVCFTPRHVITSRYVIITQWYFVINSKRKY